MSELTLSALIAFVILASMFAFVPLLDVCGPQCQRLFLRKPKAITPDYRAEPEDRSEPFRIAG